MYSNRCNALLRLLIITVSLIGTLIEASANAASPLHCRTAKNSIKMSYKEAEAFRAYYVKKFIAGDLHLSQMVCDLGKPHVVKTAQLKSELGNLSMQPGDRYARWGAFRTNNPTDEISISVVINADDMVQSYANHFPFKKELMSLKKSEGTISVNTGTYTRVVTKKTVPK